MQLQRFEFEGLPVQVVDREGRPWVTLQDLAACLYGLKGCTTSVTPFGGGDTSVPSLATARTKTTRVYTRHADEFTERESTVVDLPSAGGLQQTRIFSPRGAWMMGMLARTPKAKAFRRWVLDVLEASVSTPASVDLVQIRDSMRTLEAQIAKLTAASAVHGPLEEPSDFADSCAHVAKFLSERCDDDKGLGVMKKDLYAAYVTWSHANRILPLKSRTFAHALSLMGRKSIGKVWLKLTLRA